MSELASPLRPALPWLWRLFDAIPGSPARVGFGLALALIALITGGLLTYLAAGAAFGALKPRTLLNDLLGR